MPAPGAGVVAGEAEDDIAPPGRGCGFAGLPEFVRVIPGVIIGGRGTAPLGLLWPGPANEGRAIDGADVLAMFEALRLC